MVLLPALPLGYRLCISRKVGQGTGRCHSKGDSTLLWLCLALESLHSTYFCPLCINGLRNLEFSEEIRCTVYTIVSIWKTSWPLWIKIFHVYSLACLLKELIYVATKSVNAQTSVVPMTPLQRSLTNILVFYVTLQLNHCLRRVVAAGNRKDQLKSLCWGKRKMKSYLSLVGQKEAGREGRRLRQRTTRSYWSKL